MTNTDAVHELTRFLKDRDYDPTDPLQLEEAVMDAIEALKACERAASYRGRSEVQSCHICQKHQHAAWHEVSNGEILNPIVLMQVVGQYPPSEMRDRILGWVSFITGIDQRQVPPFGCASVLAGEASASLPSAAK